MLEKSQCASFDSTRPYLEPYGLTCVYWQPEKMRRPDYHNEIELNLLQSGSVTYLHKGRKTVVEAGKLCAFWAIFPHQVIDFEGSATYLVVTIPLQVFLEWRLPEDFVQRIMQGQFICESSADAAAMDFLLLQRWENDLRTRNKVLEKPVLLEMQARTNRLALNCVVSKKKRDHLSAVSDKGLSKVERMACFVAQNYNRKLSIQDVSETVGLHPNYAMNLFRQTFGTTLINYLTQHRIAHAQRLLTTTHLSVTDIALQSGFSSISRFNEAFFSHCNCSPRTYRNSHE